MFVVWIVITIVGAAFLLKTIEEIFRIRSVPYRFRIYLYFIAVAVYLGVQFCLENHLALAGIFDLFLMFGVGVFRSLVKWRRRTALQHSTVSILDELVLQMRIGGSLRESMASLIQRKTGLLRLGLEEIHQALVFPAFDLTNSEPLIALLANEFRAIDRSSTKSVHQMQNLRRRFKTEERFRRKSGRALAQTRAQSLILSVLFCCLMCCSGWYFGWQNYAYVYLIAAFVFSLGLIWIYVGGRRMRWTV